METKRIIQVMPADGWQAMFWYTRPDGTFGWEVVPLVGWALCEYRTEDENCRVVEGLHAFDGHSAIGTCPDDVSFVRYILPGKNPVEWVSYAREQWQEHKDREARRQANA